MRAAALALLLALPSWAQEVQDGYLRMADGGTTQVRGGVYLPSEKAQERARELLQLRAENEQLKAAPVPTPALVIAALVVGATVGFAGGAALMFRVMR